MEPPSSSAGLDGSRDGRGGGGGTKVDDWVDETALRAAMARAYETFRLMHGSVLVALDAPTVVDAGMAGRSRGGAGGGGGDGEGGGCGGSFVPGKEVLRRLASARKRLRKARREADEVCVCCGCACLFVFVFVIFFVIFGSSTAPLAKNHVASRIAMLVHAVEHTGKRIFPTAFARTAPPSRT